MDTFEQVNSLIDAAASITAKHFNERIEDAIARAIEKCTNRADQSAEIHELAAAFSKAQGEYKRPNKSKYNAHLKYYYASLEDSLEAVIPALSKHGLSISQPPFDMEDGRFIIVTKLLHSSGQWMSSRVRVVPEKNNPQALGSQITYMKKYAINAMLGIGAGDIDDDGEEAMRDTRKEEIKGVSITRNMDASTKPVETITDDQLIELEIELEDWPDIAEDILKGYKIRSLADIPKAWFHKTTSRVRELKLTRSGMKSA